MKPNELRIGNYCQTDKGYLLQVNALSENGVDFHLVDREKHPIKETWQAEFIPLTEEWLIRFGFKPFGKDGFYSIEAFSPGHPSQRFDIDWNEEKGIMCKSRYQQDSEWFFMRHIQSVHQLQNLYFSLTGEEFKLTDQ